MCNCAWNILRGASEASTKMVMAGAVSARTENEDSRMIPRQKNFITPQRERVPILPPDFGMRPRATEIKCTLNIPVWRRIARAAGGRSAAAFAGLASCYHLRRGRAREIYQLRRARWERQEHAGRKVGAVAARAWVGSGCDAGAGGHCDGGKDPRSAAAFGNGGTFSIH